MTVSGTESDQKCFSIGLREVLVRHYEEWNTYIAHLEKNNDCFHFSDPHSMFALFNVFSLLA